jgi:hypothetical protein
MYVDRQFDRYSSYPPNLRESLAALGERVVPKMTVYLDSEKGYVRLRAIRVLADIQPFCEEAAWHVVNALDDPDPEVCEAVRTIIEYNPAYNVLAGPKLIRLAGDRRLSLSDRVDFLELFNAVGAEGCLPALTMMVEDREEDERIRTLALQALVRSGGSYAIPVLVTMIHDEETTCSLYTEAIRLLPETGYPLDQFLDVLLRAASQDDDEELKLAAYSVLSETQDYRAQDFFLSALEALEPEECLPDELLQGLSRLQPDPVRAIPPLLNHLVYEDELLDSEILETLGHYGRQAEPALPVLMGMLNRARWLELDLLKTVSKIEPALAVDPLIDIVEGDFEWTAPSDAASLLISLGEDPAVIVPALRHAIKDARSGSAEDLAYEAARLGTRAKAVGPEVIEAILEERIDPLDGALVLGLVLKGSGRIPPLLDEIMRQLCQDECYEDLEWIRKSKAAIMGDRASAERIRAQVAEDRW